MHRQVYAYKSTSYGIYGNFREVSICKLGSILRMTVIIICGGQLVATDTRKQSLELYFLNVGFVLFAGVGVPYSPVSDEFDSGHDRSSDRSLCVV